MTTKTNYKILYVIGSLFLGGAENQIALLAVELVKRGWQVHLFSLEGDGPLKQLLDKEGVIVHSGGYDSTAPRRRKIYMLLRAQWRLFFLALQKRPSVLHAFLPLTNFMGALTGRLAGINTVITSRRALGTHQDRHPWWAKLDRVANVCSTFITANSQAVMDDTIQRDGVPEKKMVLIYNGLNFEVPSEVRLARNTVRSTLGLLKNQIAIVSVANLIPYKGHKELITAFASLCETRTDLVLFLIGEDRGIGTMLKQQTDDLGISDRVQFLGRRSDVMTLLMGMDVGVMSSHEEGFSNALLEKLAAGLPVVATAVGGNPEALAGMPDCVLVNSKDCSGLASGLSRLIDNINESASRNSVRASMVIARYSVQATVELHESIYLTNKGR